MTDWTGVRHVDPGQRIDSFGQRPEPSRELRSEGSSSRLQAGRAGLDGSQSIYIIKYNTGYRRDRYLAQIYPGSDRRFEISLDDGTALKLRPMTADDREALRQGISKLSFQSRYFRFFSGFAEPPPNIVEGLADVDGHRHIAWCAVDLSLPETPAVAAVHAIRTSTDDLSAELAFAVLDDYHHRGIARLLIAAVLMDVKATGLEQMSAEVLAENKAAARLFRALGAGHAHRTGDVLSFDFTTSGALKELSLMTTPQALETVLSGVFTKDA